MAKAIPLSDASIIAALAQCRSSSGPNRKFSKQTLEDIKLMVARIQDKQMKRVAKVLIGGFKTKETKRVMAIAQAMFDWARSQYD